MPRKQPKRSRSVTRALEPDRRLAMDEERKDEATADEVWRSGYAAGRAESARAALRALRAVLAHYEREDMDWTATAQADRPTETH